MNQKISMLLYSLNTLFDIPMLSPDGTRAKVSLMADLKAAVDFAERKKLEVDGAKEQVGDVE